ncbi:MAG: PaaI family thioesterase [Polaromonas sp.]|nr:PaaI family thioesterase [Polaromonas sp.]
MTIDAVNSSASGGFPAVIPLAALLGFQLERMDAGQAVVSCGHRKDLCNSYGFIHGGTLMALMDIALVHAARAPDEPAGPIRAPCVTVDMSTSFIGPASGRLHANARVVGRTASLSFCEAVVTGPGGEICARGIGTLRHIQPAATAPQPPELS